MAYNINSTALLRYYPFDSDLSDYASGAPVSNATVVGVSVSSAGGTKLNSGAAFFSGAANQVFNIPALQFNTNGITVSTWIKSSQVPVGGYVRWFDFAVSQSYYQFCVFLAYFVGYYSENVTSGLAGGISSGYIINDMNWHHYCLTITSAATNNATLYIDNVAVLNWTTYPTTSVLPTCKIGVSHSSDPMFYGYMNQFVVFNRAITATERNYLYQSPNLLTFSSAPTGANASLTFNVNSSNLLYYLPLDTDLLNYPSTSGTGQTAFAATTALTVGNTYTKLTSGSAVFNGNTTVARLNPFSLSGNGLSVALWTLTAAGTPDGCLYDFAVDASATSSTSLLVNQGNLAIRINNASSGTSTTGVGTRTNYVYPVDGAWHHVCHTITSAGVNTVYVDGTSIGNTRVAAYPSVAVTLANAFVGKSSNNSVAPWAGNNRPGYMNQVLVFNRALTEMEVSYIARNPTTVTISSNASASSTAYFLNPNTSNYRSVVPVSIYYMTGDTFAGRTYTLRVGDTQGAILGNATAATTGGGLTFEAFDVSTYKPGTTSLVVVDNTTGSVVGAPVALNIACFLESTLICKWDPVQREEAWVAVETLKKGDFIKTSCSGYKRIQMLGRRRIHNAGPRNTNLDNQMHVFRVSLAENREAGLFADLYVTGNHCVLRKTMAPELRRKVTEVMGDVYITEESYRVPACVDLGAEKWDHSGEVTVWHFALENTNRLWNYGVYANGLLVESSSLRYMEELAGMEIIR